MTQALTRGRIARLAAEHDWMYAYRRELVDAFVKGSRLIRIRYSRNGHIVHAGLHGPNGHAEYPELRKSTYVRGWLTQ